MGRRISHIIKKAEELNVQRIFGYLRACLGSRRVRIAPSDFVPDEAKILGNTLCIAEDFGKIWRKRCKRDVREEILDRL